MKTLALFSLLAALTLLPRLLPASEQVQPVAFSGPTLPPGPWDEEIGPWIPWFAPTTGEIDMPVCYPCDDTK